MQGDSPPAGTLPRVGKRRLDTLLAERGLYESRSRAAAAVIAGDVRVARPARPRSRASWWRTRRSVAVAEPPPYVSRGGIKLANALDAFGIDPAGRRALDVGASTGGFTDVLLQRGAASVIALDVAYGELHWRLRNDERVIVIERRNARSIEPGELPYAPDLIVADLSFISLTKVLPAVVARRGAALRPARDGQAAVRGGPRAGGEGRRGALGRRTGARRWSRVGEFARTELGLSVLGYASSGLPGPGREPRDASSGSPSPAARARWRTSRPPRRRAEPS